MEIHRLSTLLAHAFHEDPMQRWLFPRDDRRVAQIAELMARDIEHRLLPFTRLVYGSDGHSASFVEHRLEPVAPATPWRVAPAFLSLVGSRAVRAWRMLRLIDAAHSSIGPHLYLGHLAVAKPHRGAGRASALLHHTMTTADDLDVGVYVETANPASLPLYARHGLVVLQEIRVPRVPPVWTLWRPPSSTGQDSDGQG